MIQKIHSLHAAWERLTGQRLVLDCMRERCWFDWLERGLTDQDLELLVRSAQARIRAGKLSPSSLKFRYMLGNTDQAEEDVAELKARKRQTRPETDPGKAAVLRATGRQAEAPAPEAVPARIPVAEVIAAMRRAVDGT